MCCVYLSVSSAWSASSPSCYIVILLCYWIKLRAFSRSWITVPCSAVLCCVCMERVGIELKWLKRLFALKCFSVGQSTSSYNKRHWQISIPFLPDVRDRTCCRSMNGSCNVVWGVGNSSVLGFIFLGIFLVSNIPQISGETADSSWTDLSMGNWNGEETHDPRAQTFSNSLCSSTVH